MLEHGDRLRRLAQGIQRGAPQEGDVDTLGGARAQACLCQRFRGPLIGKQGTN